MPTNIRKLVEANLDKTLEGSWGLPIVLINPDGEEQTIKKGTSDILKGQVNYVTVETEPDTGERVVVNKPNVAIRLSSLDRIPAEGEKWSVRIPPRPDPDIPVSEFDTYVVNTDRAMGVNSSIGFIILHLFKANQA